MSAEARRAVIERLRELFDRWPDEQALEFADGAHRTWFTWREIGDLHRRLVELLIAEEPECWSSGPVAIVLRQSPATLAAELAVLAEGRTVVVITPLQADRSLVADIEQVHPSVVVAHPDDWARPGFHGVVAALGSIGVAIDDHLDVEWRTSSTRPPEADSLDAAVTVLTSGTSGPAKRLPVSWSTFVELGGGAPGRPAESGRGALILSLPLVTLGGLLSLTRLVFGGRPMAMMPRFDVHTWASLVREHRPKVMGAPPPVVQMILDADIDPIHFAGVTAYLTSSAAVPADVARAFEARYGIPVLLGYGATEFLGSVTGWTIELWERFGDRKVGSVGRVSRDVGLRIVGDDGEPIGPGLDGIVEVDPPRRAGHLPSGWLRTSDRGRLDDDGFLWILGRVDDVIVRGGFKVDLHAVEAVLREHPSVRNACVVGLADDRLGQVPAALVTLGPGAGRPGVEELLAFARERLAPFAVPVHISVGDTIPMTSTLKPHRHLVGQRLAAERAGRAAR